MSDDSVVIPPDGVLSASWGFVPTKGSRGRWDFFLLEAWSIPEKAPVLSLPIGRKPTFLTSLN